MFFKEWVWRLTGFGFGMDGVGVDTWRLDGLLVACDSRQGNKNFLRLHRIDSSLN
jgi:hypothetical protein